MRFKSSRAIDRLALPITRACQRQCPECPARQAGPSHVPVDELKWAGRLIGPVGKVEVTGGEPSLHPEFEAISAGLHEWFDSKDIMLLTNGGIFVKDDNLPLLLHYDRVYVTWYTNEFATRYGGDANTGVVNKIEDYLKGKGKPVHVQRMDAHNPLTIGPRTEKAKCVYGYDQSDMVAYHRGQIYGCCTCWQLSNRGRGIVLAEDWRERLSDIDLPCSSCFLGRAA